MYASFIFSKGLALLIMLLLPLSAGYPTNCTEVVIPVTVGADGIYMAPDTTMAQALDLVTNTISFLLTLLFDNFVQGTFNVAARYCEPEVFVPQRANTLQLLLHGATYDRNYWSADGPPGASYNDTNSWVTYASQQGYSTLAIDRIGCGNSSKPDPILVVQTPIEVEVAHQIIQMARQGSSPFPRKFAKIIVVGHSMGSVITQLLSVNHPADADAIILTGYSRYIVNFLPGIFVTAGLLPAALVQPEKYGNLPFGYLEPSIESGVKYLFWYDPFYNNNGTYYDPEWPAYDYAFREAITVGEGATGGLAAATSFFKGPVLTITGEQDALFCGTLALPISGPGQCVGGSFNYLADTASLYPEAKYYWYAVPNANHCWQFHYSAHLGFQVTHNWLANMKF